MKEGRPQDSLGQVITVGIHEVLNESHRIDPRARLDELADLVRNGVKMAPILLTRRRDGRLELLAGERRFDAQVEAGKEKVRAYVARNVDAVAAWLELDMREPGRGAMTKVEAGYFTAKAVIQLSLNVRQVRRLDEALAAATGVDVVAVRETRQLVKRLNGLADGPERDSVLADMALVDSGLLRPNSALSRSTLRRKAAEAAANALPAYEQAQILKRVVPTLNGIVEAIDGIGPLSNNIPDNVRELASKAFNEAARALKRRAIELTTTTTRSTS